MKNALLSTLLAYTALAIPAQAAWTRIASPEKQPVDLASSSVRQTKVDSSKGIGQPENLLSDDVAASSTVGAGASEVVLNLGKQAAISQIVIVNDGSEGSISVASSVSTGDQRAWTPLTRSVYTAADRSIMLKFAASQAKFIKLQWDLSKGGSLRGLSIYGGASDRDYKVTEDASSSSSVNVGGGLGGSRVIYIHPSPVRGDEIGAKFGRFEFPESPEKYRTVIYDLGKERSLTEIGSVHSPRPVRFVAYAFEKELPEATDWRGRPSFDPAVFDTLKPIATVEDSRGVGYVKAKFEKAVRARYFALRWEPDFNPPSLVVSSVSMAMSGSVAPNNPAGQGNGNGSGQGGNGSGENGSNTDANGNPVPGGATMQPSGSPFSIGSAAYAGQPGLGGGGTAAGGGGGGGRRPPLASP